MKKTINVLFRGNKYKVIDIIEKQLSTGITYKMYKIKTNKYNILVNSKYCIKC